MRKIDDIVIFVLTLTGLWFMNGYVNRGKTLLVVEQQHREQILKYSKALEDCRTSTGEKKATEKLIKGQENIVERRRNDHKMPTM